MKNYIGMKRLQLKRKKKLNNLTESHTPSVNEDKNNFQEGEEITFEEATERGKI